MPSDNDAFPEDFIETVKPAQSIPVYISRAFRVSDGVNLDDPITIAADLMLDDTFELRPDADRARLSLSAMEDGTYIIAPDTETGEAGARIIVDSCLTVMSPDSTTLELLVLVQLDEAQHIAETYVLPLATLSVKSPYRLVGIQTDGAARKLSQVACVAFTRGTMITLSTGAQCLIEDLKAGDKVLTRDDGPQEIRWIGQNTVRAVGHFAPILIKAGTLNNTNDLIVSPDHRLFIYQRQDALGAGRSEVLVKARHLINGDTVSQQDGGFVDYFQLLFDQHQIIYAEGIAAETLLVDTRTRAALTDDVSAELMEELKGHSGWLHSEYEVGGTLLGPDAAEKLKNASKR